VSERVIAAHADLAAAVGARYKPPVNQPRPRGDLPHPELQRALDAAIDTKALGPVILRVTEIAGYTDYVLLVSGRSSRHVEGITQAIVDALRAVGRRPIGTDGLEDHLWDLLDYDDFLVHVFYHPVRAHYDLESMWKDAPKIALDLPEDVMDTSSLSDLPPPDTMPGYRGREFGGFADELARIDDDRDLEHHEDDELDEQDEAAAKAADDEYADLDEEYEDEDEPFGEDDDFADDDFDDDDNDFGDDDDAAAPSAAPDAAKPAAAPAKRRR